MLEQDQPLRTAHPILLTFGQTLTSTFPLILAIGREPNTPEPIRNILGTYDFRRHPRCGFWNTSYSVVARVAGKKTRQLKHLCVSKGASPIVYADALPIGVPNAIRDKDAYRRAVSSSSIAEHIANIFAYRDITARVALIMVSGLYSPIFDTSKQQIEAACRSAGISYVHVPFFYGTNTRKIYNQLSPDHHHTICTTVEQLKRYSPT